MALGTGATYRASVIRVSPSSAHQRGLTIVELTVWLGAVTALLSAALLGTLEERRTNAISLIADKMVAVTTLSLDHWQLNPSDASTSITRWPSSLNVLSAYVNWPSLDPASQRDYLAGTQGGLGVLSLNRGVLHPTSGEIGMTVDWAQSGAEDACGVMERLRGDLIVKGMPRALVMPGTCTATTANLSLFVPEPTVAGLDGFGGVDNDALNALLVRTDPIMGGALSLNGFDIQAARNVLVNASAAGGATSTNWLFDNALLSNRVTFIANVVTVNSFYARSSNTFGTHNARLENTPSWMTNWPTPPPSIAMEMNLVANGRCEVVNMNASTIVLQRKEQGLYTMGYTQATSFRTTEPLDSKWAWDQVQQHTPYVYADVNTGRRALGVSAQWFEEIPFAVTREQDGFLKLSYYELVPLLWSSATEVERRHYQATQRLVAVQQEFDRLRRLSDQLGVPSLAESAR